MKKKRTAEPTRRPLPADYGYVEGELGLGEWTVEGGEAVFQKAMDEFERARRKATRPHFAERNPNVRFWSRRTKQMSIVSRLSTKARFCGIGPDKFVPMLSTGLADVNGREVFEGDYVKWGHLPGSEEDPVRTAIVEFAPDLQFRIVGHAQFAFGYGTPYVFHFHYAKWAYQDRASNALEVTGNFFEGPHPD